MSKEKNFDNLIIQMENYLECWKLFNYYLNMARTKKFDPEDENQFLEIKCVITQELEMILSLIEAGGPSKNEVHSLIGHAPSIRYLSELNDGALRNLENQWHKIYISWQSILGQMKVLQQDQQPETFWSSLFRRKKAST